MTMKRQILRICAAVCCLLAFGACHRTENRVEKTAETFLNVYYGGDYASAAALCTPRLAALVERGGETLDQVPEETAEKMKEALSKTSFQIVSVTVDKDAASARVDYELTVPGLERPVPKSLRLEIEGRTARVDGIE